MFSLTKKYFLHSIFQFIVLSLLALFTSCGKEKESYQSIKEISNTAVSSFIGSNNCKACHQQEFDTWQGSHHDNAMKIADSVSVLGNFKNTTFRYKYITATFFKKDADFFVNTEGPDGTYADFKIEYTFGVYPLQQYLVKFDNGEYQCLSTAWDSEKTNGLVYYKMI